MTNLQITYKGNFQEIIRFETIRQAQLLILLASVISRLPTHVTIGQVLSARCRIVTKPNCTVDTS